ncbi:MAG: FecR family protein [Candidatus Krumholzibacteria bacterium]|nr:FecR family protein [Candidatus Krumholzibacteria bacterium]
MTDRPDHPWDDRTIARRVRDLPPAEADDAFRLKVRDSFVSGDIDGVSPRASRAATAPAWRRGFRWLVPVAAAFVVLAVVVQLRGPRLELLDVAGDGTVQVDERSLPTGDREALSRALRGGATVDVGEEVTLDLRVPRFAVYELTPGTRMTLPPAPGRWFGRAVVCSLEAGELRLKTGSRFQGAEMTVYTPHGMVVVTGTLLSIQSDADGTCVCVLEGTARVGVDEDDLEPVTPGYRKIMLKNGTVSIVPVKPMHRDGVLEFDGRVGQRLQ